MAEAVARPRLALIIATLCCIANVAHASSDIADCIRLYYEQQVASPHYRGPLDFLHDAAAAHVPLQSVLKPTTSRQIILDRANGYLRISDGAGTDQVLTMALYRKADGAFRLIVGSSNCADACTFLVEVFEPQAAHLQPVPVDAVIPSVEPKQFIKPGQQIPKPLANAAPTVNYLPARIGTTLTLEPWYGYEAEEQMSSTTRSAVRKIVLDWDAKSGRFVAR